MNDVNQKLAEIGDTIEILRADSKFLGHQFMVIERPDNAIRIHEIGDAWIMPDTYITPVFVQLRYYKIVESSDKQQTSGTDEFLRKQLSDNLRGIFE